MQAEDAVANTAHFRVAPDAPIPNFAKFSIGRPIRTGPYRALTIFNESTDLQSTELRVLNELAVPPACQPIKRSDPKSPVARGDQSRDDGGGEVLIRWRLPGEVPDAIEPRQPKCRPD